MSEYSIFTPDKRTNKSFQFPPLLFFSLCSVSLTLSSALRDSHLKLNHFMIWLPLVLFGQVLLLSFQSRQYSESLPSLTSTYWHTVPVASNQKPKPSQHTPFLLSSFSFSLSRLHPGRHYSTQRGGRLSDAGRLAAQPPEACHRGCSGRGHGPSALGGHPPVGPHDQRGKCWKWRNPLWDAG